MTVPTVDAKTRRRMERMIAALQHHESADMQAMGNDLLRWWFYGAAEPLERVLGLRAAPGQRSPETKALIARRDALVLQLATDHYPDRQSAAASKMHKAWMRYAASSWPRERLLPEPPRRREQTPELFFWQIMRLQDQVPSERTIRRILATS